MSFRLPRKVAVPAALAALVLVPDGWALSLPLISDDYVQAWLAAQFAPMSGWKELANDALYRCRSTSLFLTYWTMTLVGVKELAFNITGLALHALNAWLVLALGSWRLVGWRISAIAAAFFVIYEGHQEAVVWYAALPELLVFTFVMLCFLAWLRWLETGRARWYAATWAAFLLALLSKESGVIVLALMLLALVPRTERRRPILALMPMAALALLYSWSIFAAGQSHLHLRDGTFSFSAPFAWNWFNSFARMYWIWGLGALILLAALRAREHFKIVGIAMAWTALALVPYSFLTYMDKVPSRHRYLASVGVALLIGAAFVALRQRATGSGRPWLVPVTAALMLVHNCGYLWFYKQPQFLKRAEPTEALLDLVRERKQPVIVDCFPYPLHVAQWAVKLVEDKPVDFVTAGQPREACGERTVLRTAEQPVAGF